MFGFNLTSEFKKVRDCEKRSSKNNPWNDCGRYIPTRDTTGKQMLLLTKTMADDEYILQLGWWEEGRFHTEDEDYVKVDYWMIVPNLED